MLTELAVFLSLHLGLIICCSFLCMFEIAKHVLDLRQRNMGGGLGAENLCD